MSDYDIILYNYKKWNQADTTEEKLNILLNFITTTEDVYIDYFFGAKSLDDIFYMNQYDINDFMDINMDALNDSWHNLIRNYTINDD